MTRRTANSTQQTNIHFCFPIINIIEIDGSEGFNGSSNADMATTKIGKICYAVFDVVKGLFSSKMRCDANGGCVDIFTVAYISYV